MRKESIYFQGRKYTRYPDSEIRTDRVYYSAGGIRHKRLHVAIWEAAHGPVPEGWTIHHKDRNPLNNALENLECLTVPEHRAADAALGAYRTPAVLANLARIQPLTVAWHSTPEGIQWHKEHGKKSWEARPVDTHVCAYCGKEYETRSRHGREKFCSRNCTTKARKASHVDDEERICLECGAAFMIDKYSRTVRCSRACAARYRVRLLGQKERPP